ncbi:MAG: TolC family protein [Phycisphaerales bacterium]
MKRMLAPALAGCLLAHGCTGPLDRRSDSDDYRSIETWLGSPDSRGSGAIGPAPGVGTAAGLEGLKGLSVEDAIRIAMSRAPSLERAGLGVEIADGRVTQAGLYPNPVFVVEAESIGGEGGAGGETSYRVEQEIVLGGKLQRARRVAEADRLAARAEVVGEKFGVASRVTSAYFGAVAARERLEARRQLIDLSQRLLDAARVQVEAGAATEPDHLRAEIVREQAEIMVESARLEHQASLRALASAMGVDEPIGIPLTTAASELAPLGSREEIEAAALVSNARVMRARIDVERARRSHELARAKGTPDLVASIGPRYSDPEGETTLDVSVGIEIPLFDRNQGEVRSAVGERMASAARLRQVRLELLSEISEAWSAYESARGASERYATTLLPKAERTLELTRQAYERGKADYLRVLDAQQVAIESRIAYVDALQRAHTSAARLHALAQWEASWRDLDTDRMPEGERRP